MKTIRPKSSSKKARLRVLPFLASIVLLTTLNSCYVETGYDGRPGDSFLSLEWEETEPDYLDAGTSSIPPVFQWGKYYYTSPGFYTLYYEGEYWDFWGFSYYAWEIDYEIWQNAGTPGGPGYNGYDGRDTYLTLVLSPYGPYTSRWEKSTKENSQRTIIEESEDKIVYTETDGAYTIKVTYKKVLPKKAKL